jgi:hypothetical protein
MMAQLGVVETYKRVKAAYPEKVTLNMPWGLQAALLDLPWNELPPDIKEALRRELESTPTALRAPPPNTT